MKSLFFDASEQSILAGNPDRVYHATDIARYCSKFIGNGVFVNPANQLQVTANGGLNLLVNKGVAYIDGYIGEVEETGGEIVTLDLNTTSQTKTIYICATLSRSNREVTITHREAGALINPVNDGNVHELVLAIVSLPPATSIITNSMITDKRPDKNYCGYVAWMVDHIDTTDLFAQFQSAFDVWFANVQQALDGDTAGNLLNMIENEHKTIDMTKTSTLSGFHSSGISFPDITRTKTIEGEQYEIVNVILDVQYQNGTFWENISAKFKRFVHFIDWRYYSSVEKSNYLTVMCFYNYSEKPEDLTESTEMRVKAHAIYMKKK